jgi:hypothetical protein
MSAIPLMLAVAKALKATTRDGLITVEVHHVRQAAKDMGGYIEESIRQFSDAMKAAGGKRVANGRKSARYGFDAATIERIEREHQQGSAS